MDGTYVHARFSQAGHGTPTALNREQPDGVGILALIAGTNVAELGSIQYGRADGSRRRLPGEGPEWVRACIT